LKYENISPAIQVYADADWGNDPIDRKSFSGFTFFMASAVIAWSSK